MKLPKIIKDLAYLVTRGANERGDGNPVSQTDIENNRKVIAPTSGNCSQTDVENNRGMVAATSGNSSSSNVLTGVALRDAAYKKETLATRLYEKCDLLQGWENLPKPGTSSVEDLIVTYRGDSKNGFFMITQGPNQLKINYSEPDEFLSTPRLEVTYNQVPVIKAHSGSSIRTVKYIDLYHQNPEAETIIDKLVKIKIVEDKVKQDQKTIEEEAELRRKYNL